MAEDEQSREGYKRYHFVNAEGQPTGFWIDLSEIDLPEIPEPPSTNLTLGTDLDRGDAAAVTQEELCFGCYLLGMQDVGRSSLLEQIALYQMKQEQAVFVFDAHDQLVRNIISRMDASDLVNTYVLDLKDSRNFPFGINIFACDDPTDEEQQDRVLHHVMQAFWKLWPETHTQHSINAYLRHIVTTLIERPDLSLADVPRLLTDNTFLRQQTALLTRYTTREFWQQHLLLTQGKQQPDTALLRNCFDELLHSPLLRRLLCWQNTVENQQKLINIRTLIENRKNLFVSLPVNDEAYTYPAQVLGTLLMARIYAATFSFRDVPEERRPGFTLIVDEFQNFATDEFAELFAQGRKFRARQILAHQRRSQLTETNQAATLSAYTKIIFKPSDSDAEETRLTQLFHKLVERRRPVRLVVDPVDKLKEHPEPAVAQFAAEYVSPLFEGRRMRTQSTGVSLSDYIDSIKYERKLGESIGRLTNLPPMPRRPKPDANPSQTTDIDPLSSFVFPEFNFGNGRTPFHPEVPQKVLKLLTTLIYEAEKDGEVNDHDREQLILTWAGLLRINNYVLKIHNPKAFEPWLKRFEEEGFPFSYDSEPEVYQKFTHALDAMLAALIAEPITHDPGTVTAMEVARSLSDLGRRTAFVRIGSQSVAIKTNDPISGVSEEELVGRYQQLLTQTHTQFCRTPREVEKELRRRSEPPEEPEPPQQGRTPPS